jgi:hypothetical protein
MGALPRPKVDPGEITGDGGGAAYNGHGKVTNVVKALFTMLTSARPLHA